LVCALGLDGGGVGVGGIATAVARGVGEGGGGSWGMENNKERHKMN